METYQDKLAQIEERTGIRATWNVLPNNRTEAAKLVVPPTLMYAPLKRIANMPRVNYSPVNCSRCNAVLNPYCQVDFKSSQKRFVCPLCGAYTNLPSNYAGITETHLPAELAQTSNTIEYNLSFTNEKRQHPVYLFVLDLCLPEDEFESMKERVSNAILALPEDAVIGLVTFGTTIQVYELMYEYCPRYFVFRGHEDIQTSQLESYLGLRNRNRPNPAAQGSLDQRFLLPIGQCLDSLAQIVDGLEPDPWPVKQKARPLRCTGIAISVASSLLGAVNPSSAGRIIVLTGGPATVGPGMIASTDKGDNLRSHSNIDKKEALAAHVKPAIKFYTALGKRCLDKGHCVDIFGACLDQVGLHEMRPLVDLTGGQFVQSESFSNVHFVDSFEAVINSLSGDKDALLDHGMNGIVEIALSPEIRVSGCLGPCGALGTSGPVVGENETGKGKTASWKVCSIDSLTTLAFVLEICATPKDGATPPGQQRYVQFKTRYQSPAGDYILRVTTMAYRWAGREGARVVSAGFDQEAAIAAVARIACWKAESMPSADVLRWVDRAVIKLTARFSQFEKNRPETVKMQTNFMLFPQFVFHLRRSPILNVFGMSPDETAYYRHHIMRADVRSSVTMVQPVLIAYKPENPDEPGPVDLDSRSANPQHVLLMDTFHHVLVWRGDNVVQWEKQGLAESNETVSKLIQYPVDDAEEIITSRFPRPRYTHCDQGKSQARFLLAKLNPANTYTSGSGAAGEVMLTDDVNLQKFLDHLKKVSVSE
ncbi:COPII coat complex component, Sec23 (Sec23) [Carpediemonas membranifera]|uniref:Protein transport protein SEC23 n=1 Tax=Carpediemonas membranifera TaxID=201153 RepID=A0A8J6BUL2_9EUKA|nr:COPII coat complex component, Sec23 (Sec23) [Carpediemonas membranifera]|eukprot:KAG9390471.1 COPII coat complex component, Sec23 (Sec23) [Carpediemonas membranifera]